MDGRVGPGPRLGRQASSGADRPSVGRAAVLWDLDAVAHAAWSTLASACCASVSLAPDSDAQARQSIRRFQSHSCRTLPAYCVRLFHPEMLAE